MSAPVLTTTGRRLYDELAPLARDADEANGYPLALFCDALASCLDEVADLARDGEDGSPGWTLIFDPDTSPAAWLPWIAQLVGVRLPPGLDEAAQRLRIKETDGLRRGTPEALKGAARQTLTGTRTAYLTERHGSPYKVTVATWAAETPDTDLPLANVANNGKVAADLTNWRTGTGNWWMNAGGTLARVASGGPVLLGTQPAAYVSFTGTGTSVQYQGVEHIMTPPGGFKAGRTYHLDVYLQGVTVSAPVDIYLGAAAAGNNARLTVTPPAGWTRYRVTWSPTVDLAPAYAGVRSQAAGTTAEVFYVAGLTVMDDLVDVQRPYADGDAPGWAWDGAVNASTAHRIPTTIVRDALLEQKPAGLVLAHSLVRGGDFNTLRDTHADFATVTATFATFDDLRADPARQ